MYGMEIHGAAGNLILDNEHLLLCQRGRGKIKVTQRAPNIWWDVYNGASPVAAHYVFCTVRYPGIINETEPPFVFAIPTDNAVGGFGMFTHTGTPGAWTGFTVVYIPKLAYQGGYAPAVGTDTGWEFAVCAYGAPPSEEDYGLRMWDANQRVIYDSTWDIVPFRNLLTGWSFHFNGKYGGNNLNNNRYWGCDNFSDQVACDTAYEVYKHPWGAANGSLGVLISSLAAFRGQADVGSWTETFYSAPMVGFLDKTRTNIHASVMFGVIQHTGTVYPMLNSFALMTADFTGT